MKVTKFTLLLVPLRERFFAVDLWGVIMKYDKILVVLAIIGIVLVSGCVGQTELSIVDDNDIVMSCQSNRDCEWVSTNCCPESGGAYWQCINVAESMISCPEGGGCYQFVSPKPETGCFCLDNQCLGEQTNKSSIELHACSNDQDCIAVSSGCCGCSSGGTAIAINKIYQYDWNSNLSQICKEIACTLAISGDISCFSEPVCVNNTCRLIPNKDYVCNYSLLLVNCKEHTPEGQWDEIQIGSGISCREVIELCEGG